jgi:hypothetical protein
MMSGTWIPGEGWIVFGRRHRCSSRRFTNGGRRNVADWSIIPTEVLRADSTGRRNGTTLGGL